MILPGLLSLIFNLVVTVQRTHSKISLTDVVINVQGDEPFISKKPLQKLIAAFDDHDVKIASLMHKFAYNKFDPNKVKVVVDKSGFALYFSRAEIPFFRDEENTSFFQHF